MDQGRRIARHHLRNRIKNIAEIPTRHTNSSQYLWKEA
jgi:hypothetical protein